MATVFFSYSHVDENLRDQLEKHLSALKHQGLIEAWHDRQILPGQDFDNEISDQLEAAEVILLLVSSDFLASRYCYEQEMMRAMQRHEAREAIVIPVILRPCDWNGMPFGKLQATPKDGRAVTLWPNSDEAFLDVVTAIKRALNTRGATASRPAARRTSPPASRTPQAAPRSSNLRLKKSFTQFDKDRFLREGFDYLALFFENSLRELSQRNDNINHAFNRVDANRFTAAIYRHGEKVSQCTVFLGGMIGGIGYSNDDHARTSSYNESLSVEADELTLFLKPMGMRSYGDNEHDRLGFEGAAEYLWEMLIDPIQRG